MPTNSGNRWKLGVFTVLGMGLAFLTIIWLGTAGFGQRTDRVVSYFDESVQGLDVGSSVKFRGVGIGHVADISIAPDQRHVAVTSEINLDALTRLGFRADPDEGSEEGPFPLNLRVRLVSLGITGLKFLEVDTFDTETLSTTELGFEPVWNHLPATPSLLKSAEEGLQDLLNRIPDLEMQTRATLLSAEETLDTVRRAIEPFAAEDTGLANLAVRLEQAASSLDAAATTLNGALRRAKVGETTASIRNAAESVADAAHEATGLGSEIRQDLVAVRELVDSLSTFADHLERDPGALLRGRREAMPGERNP